jgi:hypothetical protein
VPDVGEHLSALRGVKPLGALVSPALLYTTGVITAAVWEGFIIYGFYTWFSERSGFGQWLVGLLL